MGRISSPSFFCLSSLLFCRPGCTEEALGLCFPTQPCNVMAAELRWSCGHCHSVLWWLPSAGGLVFKLSRDSWVYPPELKGLTRFLYVRTASAVPPFKSGPWPPPRHSLFYCRVESLLKTFLFIYLTSVGLSFSMQDLLVLTCELFVASCGI